LGLRARRFAFRFSVATFFIVAAVLKLINWAEFMGYLARSRTAPGWLVVPIAAALVTIEVPTEVVVTVENRIAPDAPGVTVHHLRLSGWQWGPNLQRDDVQIVPILRNANVTQHFSDRPPSRVLYDADGQRVATDSGRAMNGIHVASSSELRFPALLPPTAAAVGASTIAGFLALRRRKSAK
jgi:hypothetical protein